MTLLAALAAAVWAPDGWHCAVFFSLVTIVTALEALGKDNK